MGTRAELSRTMLLWFPDWPVHAAAAAAGLPVEAPLVLTEKSLVFAASATARTEGIRRGMRIREAQSRSADLVALPYDSVVDNRAFEPVVIALEEITPGVQIRRPGLCAIRLRGPARYYGGEREAAHAVLLRLGELGFDDARIGMADGLFASELSAKLAARPGGVAERMHVVEPGGAAAFLAPLPVQVLDDPAFVTLLRRLGIRTLGEFAALSVTDVRSRFGEAGAAAHHRASGAEMKTVSPRIPPQLLERAVDFEPPLDRIDQITFAVRTAADGFVSDLVDARLVCTALTVEVTTESGEVSVRTWLHPRWFGAADVVDRVRWQLQGSGAIDAGLRSAVTRVRVQPEAVDAIGNHEQGLWGTAPEERVHHGLSRVQSMLGHDAVVTAVISGGRAPAERQLLVPWGDRAPSDAADPSLPWPGSMPPPFPPTVFETPRPVLVQDARGESVGVDERGALTGEPVYFSETRSPPVLQAVEGWAGPWAVDERWWDPARARSVNRFQVVDARGMAWLVMLDRHEWFAEARYD